MLGTVLDSAPVAIMIVSTIIFVLEVSRAAYRLWLHPLSSFPGPVRAAVSNAWLYELSKCGEQEQEFEKLHIAYGILNLLPGVKIDYR